MPYVCSVMSTNPTPAVTARILKKIKESVDAEKETKSSQLLRKAEKGNPETLLDLERMAHSVSKAQTLTRWALELAGVSLADQLASRLDQDLKMIRSELVTLSKGHTSKILMPADPPSPRMKVVDDPLSYRLRLMGSIYSKALRELGETKAGAERKIKSITRGELTPDKLRHFSEQLEKHGRGKEVTITFEGWIVHHRFPQDSESGNPDDRVAALKRAADEMKKNLIDVATEVRAHSRL